MIENIYIYGNFWISFPQLLRRVRYWSSDESRVGLSPFCYSPRQRTETLILSFKSHLGQWLRWRKFVAISESNRTGLLSVPGRKLTGVGVKPVGITQWSFKYRWLYGAVEPLSGESFVLELSHLDSHCFEGFLEQFALQYLDEVHVIQVDNAGAHRAQHV